MQILPSTILSTTPQIVPVKIKGHWRKLTGENAHGIVTNCLQIRQHDSGRGHNIFAASNRRGFGLQLQPLDKRQPLMYHASTICSAASNATCSASGQSQTATIKPKTIQKAPENSPKLDDGGTGFPPRDDGGGGGGGGGGGNWSGGFFFFGFLAFLAFLKDQESNEDYRDNQR